jgi:D-alanyl-lipoteichoic acid acyltransferase DltB (MBOAT superfamily)
VLFHQLQYLAFLVVVFVVYWATVRRSRFPVLFLLGASYVFYASWNASYLLLVFATSTFDYLVGGHLHSVRSQRHRKVLLGISIVYNLGVLATFKYFNFFMESVDDVAALLGVEGMGVRAGVLLPVGISFFTFQSMSYTWDIYRRQLEPSDSYARYLLYVAFFPQLVAGPIVRARDLLPQLAARPALNPEMGGRGLFLIALGLFKKVAIADYLAVNAVDRVFSLTHQFSGVETLVGVYAYALQIYCDFSGYSDVAIGSALLLGFTLPDNFDAPYKSRSLQEFWRRWHISLSTWLRDYLYIPLGGSRFGALKTYRNLLITMLLGGLWHGAAWNFVVWGALHGGALAVQRAWQRRCEARGRAALLSGRAGAVVAALVTFHFVCFTWIFFRAPDFGAAVAVLEQIATGGWETTNVTGPLLLVMAVGFGTHLFPRRGFEWFRERFVALPAAAQGAALVVLGLALRQVATQDVQPFIYFQF